MGTEYTDTLKLNKPDFRSPDWADRVNENMDTLDAAIRNILLNPVPWENDTFYGVGQIVIDTVSVPVSYWINNVDHTSVSNSENTFELREDNGIELREDGGREIREGGGLFAQERTIFPLYWTLFSFGLQPRGAWVHDRTYFFNDISYDSVLGITGICKVPHVSNHSGTIVDDAANWDFIVNLPTVFTAAATTYSSLISGLDAHTVQDAIDAVNTRIIGAYLAQNVAFDNTGTSLLSVNLQSATIELKQLHDVDANAIAINTAAIAAGLIGTGFPHWRPTNEVLSGWIIANGTSIGSVGSGATQRANDDCLPLYAWHYNNFSNTECPVSGGRGANAAADFAAGKPIVVLDMKGTGAVGADTMGALATTRLSGVPVTSGTTTTPGSILGENTHTLTLTEIPTGITAANTGTISLSVNSTVSDILRGGVSDNFTSTAGTGQFDNLTKNNITSVGSIAIGAIASASNNTSGATHNNRGRDRTGWWYLHL